MTVHGEPLAYYFAHVDNDTEDCTLWPYATSRGYGRLLIDGQVQSVHVLACERHHGPRPAGMHAIHAPVVCHNILCFNWRHLRWGTQRQNFADKVLDGTDPAGERHGQAKVTWKQVAEIRACYAAGGISQLALAAEYGVSPPTIRSIITGRTWRTSPK